MALCARQARRAAINKFEALTPSVVALASIAGVKPADLAKALYDEEAVGDFGDTLLINMIKAAKAQAKKEGEEEKEKE